MKSLLKFIIVLVPFMVVSGYVVFKDRLPTYIENNGLVAEAIIPEGWYAHALSTSTLLLTQSRFLPHIEGTEGYAYGEQIAVSVSSYDGELGEEESWYQLDWTNEEDAYGNLRKEWLTLGGHKVLRLEYDGMTSGGDLNYQIFYGDTVHTVSLYPAYNSPHLETFEGFLESYLKSLGTSDD